MPNDDQDSPMTEEEAQELADEISCCPDHDPMVKRLVRDYLALKESKLLLIPLARHASDCAISEATCTCGGVEGWPTIPPSEGDPWELAAQRLRVYTSTAPEWFRRAVPAVGSIEEGKLLRGCAGWLEPYIRHLLRQMQYDAE